MSYRSSKFLSCLKTVLIAAAVSVLSSVQISADENGKNPGCIVPQTGTVAKTYNQKPFAYRAKLVDEKDEYRVFRVTYPSPIETTYEPNNTVPADYYLPKGIKPDEKRPGVVCLHILHGQFELVRMVCSTLAKRGIPAIMIKLPYYGERSLPGGFSSLHHQGDLFCQGMFQGLEDIRRTVDFLESRPEVDPDRIGVTGMSFGAILSARVAADEPRFSKIVIVFGGGDLPHLIDHAKETRPIKEYLAKLPAETQKAFETKIHQIDPLTHAAKLKPRAEAGKVRMYNGLADETITPRNARKLAAAMGMEDKIKWYEGVGHYTFFGILPKTLDETVEFFADDMPAPKREKKPVEKSLLSGNQLVADWLGQLHKLLTMEPEPGCYHKVDLTVQTSPGDEKTWQGRLCFTRGSGSKFKLHITVIKPVKFEAVLGCDEYPWIAAPEKNVVFCGTRKPEDETEEDPIAGSLDGVKSEYVQGWGIVKSAIAAVAMSPILLEQFVEIEEVVPALDGDQHTRRQIQIKPKQHRFDTDLIFSCPRQAEAIDRLDFKVKGIVGNVNFTRFRIDEKQEKNRFSPAKDLKHVEVERDGVYRTISSTINFLVEKAM